MKPSPTMTPLDLAYRYMELFYSGGLEKLGGILIFDTGVFA